METSYTEVSGVSITGLSELEAKLVLYSARQQQVLPQWWSALRLDSSKVQMVVNKKLLSPTIISGPYYDGAGRNRHTFINYIFLLTPTWGLRNFMCKVVYNLNRKHVKKYPDRMRAARGSSPS